MGYVLQTGAGGDSGEMAARQVGGVRARCTRLMAYPRERPCKPRDTCRGGPLGASGAPDGAGVAGRSGNGLKPLVARPGGIGRHVSSAVRGDVRPRCALSSALISSGIRSGRRVTFFGRHLVGIALDLGVDPDVQVRMPLVLRPHDADLVHAVFGDDGYRLAWSFAGTDSRQDVSSTFLQPFLSYTTKTYTICRSTFLMRTIGLGPPSLASSASA